MNMAMSENYFSVTKGMPGLTGYRRVQAGSPEAGPVRWDPITGADDRVITKTNSESISCLKFISKYAR